jgi:uncharacterized membrane protein YozB (DUF420 family)
MTTMMMMMMRRRRRRRRRRTMTTTTTTKAVAIIIYLSVCKAVNVNVAQEPLVVQDPGTFADSNCVCVDFLR